MNLQYLKDKPAVQFAVGLTAILIMATWFFTGDLPFVSSTMFQKPAADAEGNVQALPPLAPVLASMGFQAVCWIGTSLIGLLSGLYSMITGALNKPAAVSQAVPVAATAGTTLPTLADASYGLCKGAEENDPVKMEENRIALRLPRVTQLQTEAIQRGDLDEADKLMEELRTLLKPEAVKARKGANK